MFHYPGSPARRETSTMPQWAGSCWYYLRFIDPTNSSALIDKQKEQYWMPVDLYVGGAEHAVLHLLYARFWHKVGIGKDMCFNWCGHCLGQSGIRQVHRLALNMCVVLLVQVLYDLGVVSTKEPFGRLVSQGMILGEVEYTYTLGPDGKPCSEDHEHANTVKVGYQASMVCLSCAVGCI